MLSNGIRQLTAKNIKPFLTVVVKTIQKTKKILATQKLRGKTIIVGQDPGQPRNKEKYRERICDHLPQDVPNNNDELYIKHDKGSSKLGLKKNDSGNDIVFVDKSLNINANNSNEDKNDKKLKQRQQI